MNRLVQTFHRSVRHAPAADRISTGIAFLLILLALGLYLNAYHFYNMVPTAPKMTSGWWNWTDQGRYYREALAWAHGDLRPSQHWYLPLYSLLGAAFVKIYPATPFFLPDAICFVACGFLVTALAPRLAPGLPFARAFGALAFLVADITFQTHDISAQFTMKSWIEPWTTTPTAPLILGLLLATLRLRDQPSTSKSLVCGVLWGLILMTRPTEAIWTSLPAIVCCALVVVRSPRPVAAKLSMAFGGIAGAVVMMALTLMLHLIVWGWHWGDYFEQSLGTGFELRLLPLRWNWLVLDARPVHERYLGLGIVFPWVLPGFAGVIASVLTSRSNRPVHWVVGASILIHWIVYLCYRDLHPEGLWRFSNYHYFKWTQPLLCFYAFSLLWRLVCPGGRLRSWSAVAVVLLCCCWHVRFVPEPGRAGAVTIKGPHELAIRGGLTRPDEVVLARVSGNEDAIYSGPQDLYQAGQRWAWNSHVKAWALPGGMAVEPLRPLPPGDGLLRLSPDVTIVPDSHPRLGRMKLVFGLPCAIQPHRAVCRPSL